MSEIEAKALGNGVILFSHKDDEETLPGEYFPKKTMSINSDINLEKRLFLWFKDANNYPETIINEISKGDTLQSIIRETVSYTSGNGFKTEVSELDEYVNKTRLNLKRDKFKNIFSKSNKSLEKSGNVFIRITTDENRSFLHMQVIQFQKCRLGKGDDVKKVIINPDWINHDKKKDVKLPLYPEFVKMKIDVPNGGSKIEVFESVYHIKDEVEGFDHYGINEIMRASLVLNEKEYRRNNWQKNQIKRGFKKDFLFITEYPIREKVAKANDEAFKEISGDKEAGGVKTVSADGDDGKLVDIQAKYEFDFTKDDTEQKLFILWAFPRSLMGLRQTSGTFSVEQIESDYEQYMIDIIKKQEFMLEKFNVLFEEILKLVTDDLTVINMPPAIILQNYMEHMTDTQKNQVIKIIFDKYGISEEEEEEKTEIQFPDALMENEKRKIDGLEELPGGDAVFKPANLIPAIEKEGN